MVRLSSASAIRARPRQLAAYALKFASERGQFDVAELLFDRGFDAEPRPRPPMNLGRYPLAWYMP